MGGLLGPLPDLASSFVLGIPNLALGAIKQNEAQQRLQEPLRNVTGQPTPRQTVPLGRGAQTLALAPDALSDEYQDALRRAGMGARRGDSFNVASRPGEADLGAAFLQTESDRYTKEQELAADQRAGINKFKGTVQTGVGEFQQAQAETKDIQQQGAAAYETNYAQGRRDIATGQTQVSNLLQQSLASIDTATKNFADTANRLLTSVEGLKTEGMALFQDQAAKLLETATTGIQHKLAAGIAEIEGRTDIPPAAKESLKQRMSFINGMEMNALASDVYSKEHQRFTETQLAYDKVIGDTINTVLGTSAQLTSNVVGTKAQAFGQAATTMAQLSETAARLGESFSNNWSNWMATTQTMRNTLTTALAGYRTAGAVSEFDLISSMSRPFIDLAGVATDLVNQALAIDTAEYNRAVQDYNAEAMAYGIETQVSLPSYQGAAQAMGQGLYQERVINPQMEHQATQSREMGFTGMAVNAATSLGSAALMRPASVTAPGVSGGMNAGSVASGGAGSRNDALAWGGG